MGQVGVDYCRETFPRSPRALDMIGQRAGALLVGDAKQRSALCAFLRDKLLSILAASSAAPFESLHVLLEGGAVLFDSSASTRCRSGGAVSKSARSTLTSARALSGCRRCLQASRTPLPCTSRTCRSANSNKQATPGTALGADGAVRARVRFASQRCVESDACRAELASRSCQQLLAVRAMLASFGDGRVDESSELLLAVCPTLLAMPLLEDFRLQTCARLLIAVHSTD